VSVEIMAFDMQGGFHFVHQFFHLHDDRHIDDVVEVAFDADEFLGNVVADGWGHFQVMTGNRQIHRASLKLLEKLETGIGDHFQERFLAPGFIVGRKQGTFKGGMGLRTSAP
jgi:hypothetical protein